MPSNFDSWNNLGEFYKEYFAEEYGVSPDEIKIGYGGDMYEDFHDFWDLLHSRDDYDSFEEWLDALGEAGFDSEFWAAYHESS